MNFRAICTALLLSSLSITGCGTVKNTLTTRPEHGGKTPFGGVRHDMAHLKRAANGELGLCADPDMEPERDPQLALMLFCAVDLPFSLVGDIVTWPYTKTFTYVNQPVPTPPMMFSDHAAPVARPTLPPAGRPTAMPSVPTTPTSQPPANLPPIPTVPPVPVPGSDKLPKAP